MPRDVTNDQFKQVMDLIAGFERDRIASLPAMEREWIEMKPGNWVYRIETMELTIVRRPPYCDRGHWEGGAWGIADIDNSDGFPRYFMDLKRAKLEMADWLQWKIKRIRE